jgi:hypothetical protein
MYSPGGLRTVQSGPNGMLDYALLYNVHPFNIVICFVIGYNKTIDGLNTVIESFFTCFITVLMVVLLPENLRAHLQLSV